MKTLLNRFFAVQDKDATPIIVVSGLPRSGTSMMMKMLDAGGLPVFVDGIRTADTDNPKGYYELERVKQLDKDDTLWFKDAQGKAVKVISALLKHLPAEYEYYILFMQRDLKEVLASQQKMLDNRGEGNPVSDDQIAAHFARHVAATLEWIGRQPNMHFLEVDYNAMLVSPEELVDQIAEFVPLALNQAAMNEVVDPNLYRNRQNDKQPN